MGRSKYDVTDIVGLCNEIQQRAEEATHGHNFPDMKEAERLAQLGLMAELFERLEAIERRLPPAPEGD